MSKENVMDAMRENHGDAKTAAQEAPKSEEIDEKTETASENMEKGKEKKQEGSHRKKDGESVAHKKELEAKQKELDELNDRYLRMMAEYDNFRRRAAKEKEGVWGDAYAAALKEILPVMDNLERAAAFAAQEPDSPLAAGVGMTLTQFAQALEKMGVESLGEPGDPFDPTLHNAVMHVEDENLGDNVIAEVFQKGYRKGDHVIRYAMVKVAN